MNPLKAVNSPSVLRLMMFLSQRTPEGVGARLASLLADVVCWAKPSVFWNLRANLGQVLKPDADQRTLSRITRQVFYHAIRSHYDLYRSLRLSPEELATLVDLPGPDRVILCSLAGMKQGRLLVFPHLGNFDLGGQVLASYLSEVQVITLPDPPPGFRLANELRRRSGVMVTPLSSAALRQAIRLLGRGGVVSLAGDRPVSDLDEPVLFFDRPARMPSGHVRLALKTGAVLAVVCCVLSPETQRYTLYIEPPMEMMHTGNRDEEIEINMRRVLDALEAVIRRWLEQWQMFVPVWPESLKA